MKGIEEFSFSTEEEERAFALGFRHAMSLNESDISRWKELGLSYSSVRELLNLYMSEEISFGKLVEELRGLAQFASLSKSQKIEVTDI